MKRKQLKEKKLREELWEKTGWGKVANWYQNTLSAEKSTQKDLLLPELLKFLPKENVVGKRILDLGCGTGFFLKEYLKVEGQAGIGKSLGVDIDNEMIVLANQNLQKEREEGRVAFLVSDATSLQMIGGESFDMVWSIESIAYIADLDKLVAEMYRVLVFGGKVVVVMNHPAFRVPKASDWYFDKENYRQGRVIYKYKHPQTIKIDMNPGTKNKEKKHYTYTFHRPLEEYLNTFAQAGFCLTFMKEICSTKISQKGPRKSAEDKAREEIPMFLFLEFTK